MSMVRNEQTETEVAAEEGNIGSLLGDHSCILFAFFIISCCYLLFFLIPSCVAQGWL